MVVVRGSPDRGRPQPSFGVSSSGAEEGATPIECGEWQTDVATRRELIRPGQGWMSIEAMIASSSARSAAVVRAGIRALKVKRRPSTSRIYIRFISLFPWTYRLLPSGEPQIQKVSGHLVMSAVTVSSTNLPLSCHATRDGPASASVGPWFLRRRSPAALQPAGSVSAIRGRGVTLGAPTGFSQYLPGSSAPASGSGLGDGVGVGVGCAPTLGPACEGPKLTQAKPMATTAAAAIATRANMFMFGTLHGPMTT